MQQTKASLTESARSASRGVWPILFLSAAGLYLATLAPGVVWQDGGEYQVRSLLGEWTHPAGLARAHVLYVLLVWLLGFLPFASVAFYANLLAALAGAVTVANVGWLSARWLGSRWAGLIAGWTLMCSHGFWQFSSQAEVYSLLTALMSAELCALLRFREERWPGWLLLVALANGWGLAVHNFALLSAACYVVLALRFWRCWPRSAWKWALGLAGCWLLGAMPLLMLSVDAWMETGDALGVVRSALLAGYGDRLLSLDPAVTAGSLALAFPTPLLVLVAVGFWFARRPSADWFWWLLLAIWAIHFGFAAQYYAADRYSFFVPSYVPMTVFLAAGVAWLLTRRQGAGWQAGLVAMAFLPVAVYAALPTAARRLDSWRPGTVPLPTRLVPYRDPYQWFLQPWRTGCTGPTRYARQVLHELPADALLLADSTTFWPVFYVQQEGGLRPDVQVRFGRFPALHAGAQPSREQLDVLAQQGRLFVTSDQPGYAAKFLLEQYNCVPAGLVFALQPKQTSTSTTGQG